MPATALGSRWNAGKLEFYDLASGTTILQLDGPNIKAVLPTGATLDTSAGTLIIPTGAVTFAKTAMFVSVEQIGTGSAQNIAHGLGVIPAAVMMAPTNTSAATMGDYTVTEGAHTTTNVVVTVTSGKKFKVWAMA